MSVTTPTPTERAADADRMEMRHDCGAVLRSATTMGLAMLVEDHVRDCTARFFRRTDGRTS